MVGVRIIAVVWLLGAVYVLVASRFSPGVFGGITVALGIPAAIGILLRQRWAVVPAMLLCAAWGAIAVLIMVRGSGPKLNAVVLLIAAVGCAAAIGHWHRNGRGRSVWFERQ
jgi:hypothetical protein